VSSHQLEINTVHKQHIEKQIPENIVKHSLLFKNVLEAYQPQTSENGSQAQFTAGGMHTCHEILEKLHDMDVTPQFLVQNEDAGTKHSSGLKSSEQRERGRRRMEI
jgi:hypothetical protein